MPDRFVNGNPHNDNINGTRFERDSESTALRYGGDVAGLIDTLDYISGMGVRVSTRNANADALLTRLRCCFRDCT